MADRLVARLFGAQQGAVAVIVAMMVPVLLGGLAVSIDVAVQRIVFNRMQSAADAAALAGVQTLADGGNASTAAVSYVSRNLPADYGLATTAADVEVGSYASDTGFVPGAGLDANAVRVIARRTDQRGNPVPQYFSRILNVDQPSIIVQAVAARPANVSYQPPELTLLDSEAGDFNQLYAYCFDHAGSGTAASRRSQMTLVSNNLPVGSNIATISGNRVRINPPSPEDLVWPRCEQEGQSLSFRLTNTRHVKSHPVLWSNPNATVENRQPGRPVKELYTDTVITAGKETFALLRTVETVRCDTLAKCNPDVSGNVIPRGKNRTPLATGQGCEPGKFMYFGWEDRPPGQSGVSSTWLDPAWTDRDYDDIAIVMRCPRGGRLGDGLPRLVS
ncbi:hypothetical protein FHS79_003090 [Polymorphobacter multimanifer]|uniref:Putative Flp pilus-assembly TadG-like N-terminal domain-containing protein n=1 Tax=Polymorphobacter multimanifer TaxID=1070431 RepID=A0A841L9S1_9SPHN|nr:pilus assembly protein TadG-related protein [Polymorphobacter multimanifer]MBB6228896.1 hypothetical protein [Polymorphobacter multimanifer]